MKKKEILQFILAIIILVAFIFFARILAGEDNWICKDGQWVKHGQPTAPAPSTQCKLTNNEMSKISARALIFDIFLKWYN
jgi:hypothetical protein